jgi:hypothetical protein
VAATGVATGAATGTATVSVAGLAVLAVLVAGILFALTEEEAVDISNAVILGIFVTCLNQIYWNPPKIMKATRNLFFSVRKMYNNELIN